jgi:predicted nucleotidyltransferase
MKNLEEIKKILKKELPYLKEKYKVKKLGIFGSYVRGGNKKRSDIDILVEFKNDADLFDLIGLSSYLEEKIQQKVDIVPWKSIRSEIKRTVLREVVTI